VNSELLERNGETFALYAANYHGEDPITESGQTSIDVEIIIPGDTEVSTFARLDPATPRVVLNAGLNAILALALEIPRYTHRPPQAE